MAVALNVAEGIEIGATAALFPSRMGSGPAPYYDVSSDGKRFLISELMEVENTDALTVVVGWPALLPKTGPP